MDLRGSSVRRNVNKYQPRIYLLIFTARNNSCGKLMFSQSVILFTGCGYMSWGGGGVCPRDGYVRRGGYVQEVGIPGVDRLGVPTPSPATDT